MKNSKTKRNKLDTIFKPLNIKQDVKPENVLPEQNKKMKKKKK